MNYDDKISELEKNEKFLKHKLMFLEATVNSSYDGILVVDNDGNKIFQNQRAIDLWKIPKNIVDDPDGMKQVQHVMKMTKNPEQFVKEIEFQREHPDEISKDELELVDGTILERFSSPVIGEDGKHYGRIYTFHDITNRKQIENRINSLLSEKELILKEVHHRIKNNMSTMISLLTLQAATIKESAAISALNEAGIRIQTMMILYDKLYQSMDYNNISMENYLSELIDQIIENFPHIIKIKIEKRIENFELDIKKLQPLGIIINELLTNIIKYAFTGKDKGLIRVEAFLKPNPAKENNTVTIIIQDNGNGIPESIDFENSTGFGLMLVSMLAKQLDGILKIERNNGTKVILEFEK